MTDVLERGPAHVDEPARPTLSWPVRVLLSACLVAAAGIHFAMVPSHASEWLAEGIAFAVAGWIQLALAVVVLLRPSVLALNITCITNVVFIAAWAWTRLAGAPFGPEAGVAHSASFVDIACVVFQASAIVIAFAALVRPTLGARLASATYPALSVVPIAVLVVATAAIASPSASGHAHSETGGHDHGVAAGGHDHDAMLEEAGIDPAAAGADAAAANADHADGHGHGTEAPSDEPFDDKGLALLENGEMAHSYGPDEALDADTRAVLVHQLALTRLIADRFPTLGDAKAAGSTAAGPFVPGMGIHMSMPGEGPAVPPPDPTVPAIPEVLTDEQVMRPSNLLYAGTTDDAKLAGFMYYSMTPDEPVGFAGPNDHWHTHGSMCVKLGGDDGTGGGVRVLRPAELTASSCQSIGGLFVERTASMVHVWTVPGWESNRGVFSDINPSITCPDGTYHTVAEAESEQYRINRCSSNPE